MSNDDLKEFRQSLKAAPEDEGVGQDSDISLADLDPTKDAYNQSTITISLVVQPMKKDGNREVVVVISGGKTLNPVYRPIRLISMSELGELPPSITEELSKLAEVIRAQKETEGKLQPSQALKAAPKPATKAPNKTIPVVTKPVAPPVTPPAAPAKKEKVVVVQQAMDDFI